MQHRRLMIPAALVGAAGIALAPAIAEASTATHSAASHSAVSSTLSSSTTKAVADALAKYAKHYTSSATNSVRLRKANVTSATSAPNPNLAIQTDAWGFSAFGIEDDVTATGLTTGTATITVNWGDGQTSSTTLSAADAAAGNPAQLQHTYATLGDYTITTTANDGQGDTVTNTLASVATAGAEYTPYGPTRILDTRKGIGATAAPVAAHNTLKLQVTGAGTAGDTIPSGITAVVLNVTAVSPTASGFLTVYGDQDSAGDSVPNPGTSNINFKANQNVPNLVVVPVGANGVVDIANSSAGKTQILADVAGYFTPANTNKYVSITPTRILDTRKGTGTGTAMAIPAHGSVTLTVAGAAGGAIPASGVAAVAMNLTAVSGTANGVITAYPAGQSLPTVSNLNYSANQTIANMAIVPVGTNGQIVFNNNSSGSVELLADADGYYSSTTTATTASAYLPLPMPIRMIDTRNPDSPIPLPGPLATKTPVDIPVSPFSYVTSEVFNATVVQGTGNGYLSLYPYNSSSPSAAPTTSNLNYLANQTVPNLTVTSLGYNSSNSSYDFQIYLGGSGTAQLILDWFGEFDDNQSS